MGTTIKYNLPKTSDEFLVHILVFAEAARLNEKRQPCIAIGLLIGPLKNASIFHPLTWTSYWILRPVISSASEETMTTGLVVEKCFIFKCAPEQLLEVEAPLIICVDSKGLLSSITTCRTSQNKYIFADVQLLRYYFEIKRIAYAMWIPGAKYQLEAIIKKESALINTLSSRFFDVSVVLDFDETEVKSSKGLFG